MREALYHLLFTMPFAEAALWLSLLNLAMFLGGTLLTEAVGRAGRRWATQEPPPPSPSVGLWLWGLGSTALNIAVTLLGLWFLRAGWLTLTLGASWSRLLLDVLLFLLTMDALMYALHRLAHVRLFYPVHRVHHRYDTPSAITLFALHPLETLGFGCLWIVLIFCYPFSLGAVMFYTGLNLFYGLVGHVGVELYPRGWARHPFLGIFSTCTFHDQHHQDPRYNLGFYTTLWDRLFGTLHPDYYDAFAANAARGPLPPSRP